MSTNKSAAITAMNATLMSIQRIRNLLARESNHLSQEVYLEVEQRLDSLERGLSEAMAQYGANQYTQAPHLYEDDEKETARIWQTIAAKINRRY